jgi:N-acetylmuramoyl-L-alanine amidase
MTDVPPPVNSKAALPSPAARFWQLAFVGGFLVGGVFMWFVRPQVAPPTPRPAEQGPDPARAPASAYDWTVHPEPHFAIPAYAQFLEGVTIVVDPGHVGQRDRGGDWKRGPTGLREAEVNLRVALYLEEFLQAVGADVHLTRNRDKSLDLPDDEDLAARPAVANRLQADAFVSVHHNAASRPDANFSLVFFHDDPADRPASVDLARHILTGLNDGLRLSRHVDCAIRSDKTVATKSGFAVLRQAEVPAVLVEASFFTNPDEEERLRQAVYNRHEAYGMFLGLARWAQAGLPRVALAEPADGRVKAGGRVTVTLDDGLGTRARVQALTLRLVPETIRVTLDGRPVDFDLSRKNSHLRVKLPGKVKGQAVLRVDFENVFGQHVLHPELGLRVGG